MAHGASDRSSNCLHPKMRFAILVVASTLVFGVLATPWTKDTLERRELIVRACPAACATRCPDCCTNINCGDLCCVRRLRGSGSALHG
jgi:hypothetical protein